MVETLSPWVTSSPGANSPVTLETMIILNDILGYTKQFNKQINERVIWPKKYKLMMNYKPFLRYNLTKMKMIVKKKINDRR